MWVQRKSNEPLWPTSSNSINRNANQMTPRQKNRPNVPLPSKNSLTPSRVQQRLTSSPLRKPLESAINRVTRQKSVERQSKSRLLNKSSRRDDSSIIRRQMFDEEQHMQKNSKVHSQTISFVKKYFDFDSIIPINQFIERIFQEYENLWPNEGINQMMIMDEFTYKIAEMFGTDGVDPRDLATVTRDNGMIGLILQIFKSLTESTQTRHHSHSNGNNNGSYVVFSKSPNVMSINKSFEDQLNDCASQQNLRNIIQQFMESMYKEMQSEIYNKFNVEMRRMILKYRDAERLLKKVQQKLIMNADYFEAEQKWQKTYKLQEESMNEMKKKLQKAEEELKRQKQSSNQLKFIRSKLQEQNHKTKLTLQKYQNILISKFQSNSSNNSNVENTPLLNKKISSNTSLMDRTQQFNNQNNQSNQNSSFISSNEPKPFQIKIDTHFIQRDMGPPIIQTTFAEQNFVSQPLPMYHTNTNNNNSYSPLKINNDIFDSNRPSFESGIRPGTKIGQYTYSPYQSRIGKPF